MDNIIDSVLTGESIVRGATFQPENYHPLSNISLTIHDTSGLSVKPDNYILSKIVTSIDTPTPFINVSNDSRKLKHFRK